MTRPGSVTTSTSYDADGNVATQTDGNGKVTSYGYGPLGRRTSTTDPLGHTSSATYDLDGRLATSTDANGVTTTNTYDDAGRLTAVHYSDSTHAVSYGYDADGRRTSSADGTGSCSWTYDSLGRLTSTTDGAGKTVSYGYDDDGDVTSVTYPNGSTVTRGYDDADRLTSSEDWNGHTTSWAYNSDGELVTTTLPSGVVTTDSYDQAENLTGEDIVTSTTTLAEWTDTPGDTGLLTAQAVSGSIGTASNSYGYSAVDQLTTGTGAASFGYDSAGNITSLGGATLAYNDGRELTSSTVGTTVTGYGYDDDGARTSSATGTGGSAVTTGYGYNGAGTMTSATAATGTTTTLSATYGYDGDGLRTTATTTTSAGTVTNTFTWDTTPAVPELLDDSTNSYLYGPDSTPYAQISDSTGTTTYLHLDPQHNTRLLTSSTGTVTGTQSYSDYGTITASSTWTTPFGYAGEYTDPTGLTYLRARYYDPTTAQFLTVDPLAFSTGQPFSYAKDDPVGFLDPTGERFCWKPSASCLLNDTGVVAGAVSAVTAFVPGLGEISLAAGAVALTADLAHCAVADCDYEAIALDIAALIPGGEALRLEAAGDRAEELISIVDKLGKFAPELKGIPAFQKLLAQLTSDLGGVVSAGAAARGGFLNTEPTEGCK